MAKVIIIHVVGEDPIYAEVEDLPKPTDQFLEFNNPKRRDGKPIALCYHGRQVVHVPLAPSLVCGSNDHRV